MTKAIAHKAVIPQLVEHLIADRSLRVLAQGVTILAGAFLLALSTQVSFSIPGTPVPVTGQSFAVLVIGASMGSWRGASSVVFYLFGAALGLPILSGGGSGWALLSGATAGYLFGFVAAAWFMGFCSEYGYGRGFFSSWLLLLLGHALIFTCGVGWLSLFVGWPQALTQGWLIFLPGEFFKTMLAAAVVGNLKD